MRTVLVRAGSLGILAVLAFALAPASSAVAATPESITRYDAQIVVQPDGTTRVTETITYDFGSDVRHGIVRRIPVRTRYDGSHSRLYPLSALTVSMDGAPEPESAAVDGDNEQITIGVANRTITGSHTYVIGYTVAGALTGFSDHVMLSWNVVGDGWTVPVDTASATVTVPAAILAIQCFAGPTRSVRSCDTDATNGMSATFGQGLLAAGNGLTVDVSFPSGAVTGGLPILTHRTTLATKFAVTPVTVGAALALALAGVVLCVLLFRRRRPRAADVDTFLEVAPPATIPPAYAAILLRGRVTASDIAATVMDLAVRRHLYIRELPATTKRAPDWELTKVLGGKTPRLPFEANLIALLFQRRDKVRVSELLGLGAGVDRVRRTIEEDVRAYGWFRTGRPQRRVWARVAAIALVVVALVTTSALAAHTHDGLVGAGFVVGALALLPGAWGLPLPTAAGREALARLESYRRYLQSVPVEEIVEVSPHVPYALVFGLSDRWTRLSALLRAAGDRPGEGSGLSGFAGSADLGAFSGRMSRQLSTSLVVGRIGSGSGGSGSGGLGGGGGGGFSGGGGGGGGGSSW